MIGLPARRSATNACSRRAISLASVRTARTASTSGPRVVLVPVLGPPRSRIVLTSGGNINAAIVARPASTPITRAATSLNRDANQSRTAAPISGKMRTITSRAAKAMMENLARLILRAPAATRTVAAHPPAPLPQRTWTLPSLVPPRPSRGTLSRLGGLQAADGYVRVLLPVACASPGPAHVPALVLAPITLRVPASQILVSVTLLV